MIKNNITIIKVILLAVSALAPVISSAEQGDFIIRGRIIGLFPNDDSSTIRTGGATSGVANTGVEVEEAFTPELDITYMMTNNIGIELIAGTANHDVNLTGTGFTGLGLNAGLELFDTWVLPPTVTLQWHFMPQNTIRPYIGAGVNYTAFLSEDASSEFEALVGPTSVNTDNSWGWAAQAGLDIDITDRFFANIDIKYIDIDTTATLKTTTAGTLHVDVDIDPIVLGVGIGMKF